MVRHDTLRSWCQDGKVRSVLDGRRAERHPHERLLFSVRLRVRLSSGGRRTMRSHTLTARARARRLPRAALAFADEVIQ
jgi:predicted Ser/Thr protein kinase